MITNVSKRNWNKNKGYLLLVYKKLLHKIVKLSSRNQDTALYCKELMQASKTKNKKIQAKIDKVNRLQCLIQTY